MIEAAIIAGAILAATGGAVWQWTRIATQNTKMIGVDIETVAEAVGAFSAGQYQDNARLRLLLEMHLPELVLAIQNQAQWEVLSDSLLAEMATIRSRMDEQSREWQHLATRIQNGVGHRTLRMP